MSDLLYIKNVELTTESEAALFESGYGLDLTGGSTDTIVKFELWLDTDTLNTYPGTPTEIRGFKCKLLASPVVNIHLLFTVGNDAGFLGFNPNSNLNTDLVVNSAKGLIAHAEGPPIVDTDTTNDVPPHFILAEKFMGTFYVKATTPQVLLRLTNIEVITDVGTLEVQDVVYLDTPAFPDNRAYVINPTIVATPISGSVYEAVSDTQDWNYGNFYLLELATGKLYTSDELGSTTAQYFNCGWGCSYISSSVWTVGTEVVGLDRPDLLWAPQSTVSDYMWTLT